MQNQILELHSQGRTVRAISRLLKKDRRAITKVIEKGIAEHPSGYVPPWVLAINWEPAEWRTPKVHTDCHIQVLKKFYSVPFSKAKFRFSADLEDWDQSFERGLTKQKLRELGSLSFAINSENLIIVGGTGAGKTHLAVALGRRLCADNTSTMFLPVNFF